MYIFILIGFYLLSLKWLTDRWTDRQTDRVHLEVNNAKYINIFTPRLQMQIRYAPLALTHASLPSPPLQAYLNTFHILWLALTTI